MWVCGKCVFDQASKKLTICVFDCTIYGLCAQPGIAPHRSGERTAVAGDLLHLSSKLCQDSWTLSLFIASWIQEKASPEPQSYDFPNKSEPGETVWMAIHQPGCLHPPEQCVTPSPPPPGTKKVTRGFTSTFACPACTQPHPARGSEPWETTRWMTARILLWSPKIIF